MAPGDVAHVPRTPSPVAGACLISEHFRSRARLRRLLAGLRPSTLHRSLRSLRQRGFALYVRLRHYRSSLLAAASNSLTFVRGADRACCAPRKWLCDLICMPFKWLCRPTDALPVPGRTPPEGHRARTRQRHLAAYAEITVSYEIVISSGVTRIFSGFQVSGESIWVSSRAVMRRPISLFLLSTVSGGV